jgi:hypothetical protein
MYGAAHWMFELVHKCACGRTNTIQNGEILNSEKPI